MGWMNMEISKTLSRFITGENQLDAKNLGYDITNKTRATFSPIFIWLEVISKAEGAIMSCSLNTPAS